MDEANEDLFPKDIESKFSKDFIDKFYYKDPMTNQIIRAINGGLSPYKAIEHLLKDRYKIVEMNRIIIEHYSNPLDWKLLNEKINKLDTK